MDQRFIRSALFTVVFVMLFGTGSPLLVTISGKGKSNAKLPFQTVLPCATDADCNSLQNTTCIDIESSSTKTCRCEDMEFPNLGHCWLLNKDLNSLCSGAQDCYTHGNDRDSVDCIESR
ncbi:uncharacterized protein LOC134204073 [Armigeres subalbatus]|uniref:uncharacterized protein LOC134204073 n=1 Tax=Armigeres subalbatus TaxID=124917 RepID=UPI002ED10369